VGGFLLIKTKLKTFSYIKNTFAFASQMLLSKVYFCALLFSTEVWHFAILFQKVFLY
jgi:hypothetical protein